MPSFSLGKAPLFKMDGGRALFSIGLLLYKYSLIRCINKRLVFVFEMKIIRLNSLFLPTPSSTFDFRGREKGRCDSPLSLPRTLMTYPDERSES